MSLNFLLIEISFLAVVRSAFVPSIAMISHPIKSASLRKEKSLNKFFNPDGFCFLKSDAMVVGDDGA
jgi:hypothetical protein